MISYSQTSDTSTMNPGDSGLTGLNQRNLTAGACVVEHFSEQEMIQQEMPLLLGLARLHVGSSAGNRGVISGVVSQDQSRWKTVYWSGSGLSATEEKSVHALAIEAIEKEEVVCDGQYAAISITMPNCSEFESAPTLEGTVDPQTSNCALLLSMDEKPATSAFIRTLAVTLGRFLALHRSRQDDRRGLWQSTRMLQSAAAWQQLDDDKQLLESIANCCCEVLQCDRATIFLWDKARHRLVGRPAIGIEGGVLEVEDSAGIVGEVLQSGSPRWWSAGGIDGERVNRRIDQAQNFQTRSLLAVPMRNARNQIVGVFEAINACVDDHREGAFDSADVRTLSELAVHAAVAIDTQRKRMSLTRTRDRLVTQAAESNSLIGDHESIRELRVNATKVAPTDLSVLVLGKNGTGKEVLAQHIHYQSERRNGPFIAVNCAALVESLLESELFGHEKGAFTDASGARQGKFEMAHGGTLFLDEVGDLSPGGQAKLLRVLEDRIVIRVGGSTPIPVDVRVIAATNQPLQELITAKRFREDLFFRLNVVSLTLPPLAKRGDDVVLLAQHFLTHYCEKIGRVVPELTESAINAITAHSWPGNVRELRNTIERLCYLTTGDRIDAEDLILQNPNGGILDSSHASSAGMVVMTCDPNLNEATRLFQVKHVQSVIAASDGNMTEAASRLGVHRSNLYRKMRHLGMPTSEPKNEEPA